MKGLALTREKVSAHNPVMSEGLCHVYFRANWVVRSKEDAATACLISSGTPGLNDLHRLEKEFLQINWTFSRMCTQGDFKGGGG